MSSTPAAARASASLVFCTHTPTAPAARCSRAIAAHLCIFACGRRRTLRARAKSAMAARLRSIASRSITSAGVSIAATGSPTFGTKARGRRAHRRAGPTGIAGSPSLPSSSVISPSRCAVSLQPTRVKPRGV